MARPRKCRHNRFSLFPRSAVMTSITPIPFKSKAILKKFDLGEGMAMDAAPEPPLVFARRTASKFMEIEDVEARVAELERTAATQKRAGWR